MLRRSDSGVPDSRGEHRVVSQVMIDREAIRQRWRLFGSKLDERGQRHFVAVEARTAGRGGIVAVHEITGIARSTTGRGFDELEERSCSPNTVSKLLEERLGYSRQVNRKTHEGASHPDRNAQFEHINAKVAGAIAAGQPVMPVVRWECQ
jgi:hypothetical protein